MFYSAVLRLVSNLELLHLLVVFWPFDRPVRFVHTIRFIFGSDRLTRHSHPFNVTRPDFLIPEKPPGKAITHGARVFMRKTLGYRLFLCLTRCLMYVNSLGQPLYRNVQPPIYFRNGIIPT